MDNPKYPVGTRVRIINELHRNGEIGYVDNVKEIIILNELKGYNYYVRFKDKSISSFFEENIREQPYASRLTENDSSHCTEGAIRNIGSVSPVFAISQRTALEVYKESAESFSIREVNHADVTSKYFVNWFFKIDKWVGNNPRQFPFRMITHNDDFSVYGYFNNDRLDGIIRVDDYEDSYELSFFCVNESVRQNGIGQYLLRYVLRKYNDKKMILNVYKGNDAAIYIYKKYGFKIIGSGYGKGYYPKSQHYVMRRVVR